MSDSDLLEERAAAVPGEPESAGRVVVQLVAARRRLDVDALVRWSESLLAELAPEADSLVVRLTSDDEVRRLNESYRDRPVATDVLSFPGEATPEGRHLGDVVIALGVAEKQAATAHHPLEVELRHLVLHGILHCLGYDHETDGGEMEALEARLRERWTGDGG